MPMSCRQVVRFAEVCAMAGRGGGRDRSNGSETRCSTTIGLLDRRVWMEGASASVKPGQLTQWKEVVLRPPGSSTALSAARASGPKAAQNRTADAV